MFQGNGDGENPLSQASSSKWAKSIAKFAADNFLPLGVVEMHLYLLKFINPIRHDKHFNGTL